MNYIITFNKKYQCKVTTLYIILTSYYNKEQLYINILKNKLQKFDLITLHGFESYQLIQTWL